MSDSSYPAIVSKTLDDVIQEFALWRTTRSRKGRIPERLWESALSLVSSYPPSMVAKQLNVNYTDLKRRMDKGGLSGSSSEEISFMEIGKADFSAPPVCATRCQLEVETVDGTRFRCSFDGPIPDNFLSFLKSLRTVCR